MPGPLEFFFSLLEKTLQFLDHSEVFLSGRPVVEESLQLVVLLLHEGDSVSVLLDHGVEFLFDFLGPVDLFIDQILEFLLILSLLFLLPVLVFGFESVNLFGVIFDELVYLIGEAFDMVFSVYEGVFGFEMGPPLLVKLLA